MSTTSARILIVLAIVSTAAPSVIVNATEPTIFDGQFVNPIGEGADACVIKDGDRYLWCQSEGNRGVAIWSSDRPTSMGRKHVVWRAPEQGSYSKQVWAPELVRLGDRWYIYFAASDGKNENHLTYVLASTADDPLGEYELHGPLYTGDDSKTKTKNLWAIDMTMLEHQDRLYAIWSGWPDTSSDLQYLYFAAMKSPTEIGGPRVRICNNDDYVWERTEEDASSRGLHEAPQVLQHDSRTFVVYSCAASWLPTYKLGMLELIGDDPLDPSAWKKFSKPVFRSTPRTCGVGHGSFVLSPDEKQWWHIYHVKMDREPGWRRALFAQPMRWYGGRPIFGQPIAAGKTLDVASGTKFNPLTERLILDFTAETTQSLMDHYGHHQLIHWGDDGVAVGRETDEAINLFRCGEKLVLRDGNYEDVDLAATFSFVRGDRDVGVLFRTTVPAVGYDAQQGYFAGLIPGRGTVILGKTDGRHWHHIVDAKIEIDTTKRQTLRVRAVGDLIEVFVGDEQQPAITARDSDYRSGSVGVRVVDTFAIFHQLRVRPL